MSATSCVCAQVWSKAKQLGREFGLLVASGERIAEVARNVDTFPLFGGSLSRWGLETERKGRDFLAHEGVRWRFQSNNYGNKTYSHLPCVHNIFQFRIS